MKWFAGIRDLKELRKKYIKLAKENHPDKGGNEEIMKSINAEYKKMQEELKNPKKRKFDFKENKKTQLTEFEEILIAFAMIAKEKKYKVGWVAMQALKYARSYEDCLQIAQVCEYKKGWAWYKWRDIQSAG